MLSTRNKFILSLISLQVYSIVSEAIVFAYTQIYDNSTILTITSLGYSVSVLIILLFDFRIIFNISNINLITDGIVRLKVIKYINIFISLFKTINVIILRVNEWSETTQYVNFGSLLNLIFILLMVLLLLKKHNQESLSFILPQPGLNPVQPGLNPVQPGLNPVEPGVIEIEVRGKHIVEKIICPICLVEDEKESLSIQLDCNHKFHKDCIVQCCNNNIRNCPLCRKDYTNNV